MPIFPVLAATTDIRGDMNAAALEPCWNISPVRRRQVYREAAIAIEPRRIVSVERNVFSSRHEVWHPRAIFAHCKKLLGLIIHRIERRFRILERPAGAAELLAKIDRRRIEWRRETVDQLWRIITPVHFSDRAHSWQGHSGKFLALHSEELDPAFHVDQILQRNSAAGQR